MATDTLSENGDTRPPPRVWLFFLALPLQLTASYLSGMGFVTSSTALVLTGTVLFAGWFTLTWLMVTPGTDHRLRKQSPLIKRIALVIASAVVIAGVGESVVVPLVRHDVFRAENWSDRAQATYAELAEGISYGFTYNDGTALVHQAVDNLLDGTNPYRAADMVQAARTYGTGHQHVTPLRRGRFAGVFPYPSQPELDEIWESSVDVTPPEFEGKFNYPAGLFLLPATFVAIGITDLRVVFALLVVSALTWVAWRIPREKRLVFAAAALASLEVSNSIASGETGSLIFPLLLLAWVLLPERPWLSMVFMAVAVATKQTAWFYLPFYLIRVGSREGPRKIFLFAVAIAGIFAAINLPFAVADPVLWLRSVFAPMTDPMFPFGVGIVTVVTSGLVDIRSSLPFSIIEVCIFIGAIIWYTRNCKRVPHAGPILAILPLFFAWRSLWPYFYYANLIALAGILLEVVPQAMPRPDSKVRFAAG